MLNDECANRRGLTLLELLVVFSILCILVAILYPVASQAMRKGHEAVAISQLRQCAVGLAEYIDEEGNDTLPPRAVIQALTAQVNCDPGDYWRRGCRVDLGNPMVGSFGYVGGLPAVGQRMYSVENNSPVFADIFYSDPLIPRVYGFSAETMTFLPNHALFAYKDTSVRTMPVRLRVKLGGLTFSWLDLFYRGDGGILEDN